MVVNSIRGADNRIQLVRGRSGAVARPEMCWLTGLTYMNVSLLIILIPFNVAERGVVRLFLSKNWVDPTTGRVVTGACRELKISNLSISSWCGAVAQTLVKTVDGPV